MLFIASRIPISQPASQQASQPAEKKKKKKLELPDLYIYFTSIKGPRRGMRKYYCYI